MIMNIEIAEFLVANAWYIFGAWILFFFSFGVCLVFSEFLRRKKANKQV